MSDETQFSGKITPTTGEEHRWEVQIKRGHMGPGKTPTIDLQKKLDEIQNTTPAERGGMAPGTLK